MFFNAANHSDIKDNSYAYGSKLKYLTETVYKIIKVFFYVELIFILPAVVKE